MYVFMYVCMYALFILELEHLAVALNLYIRMYVCMYAQNPCARRVSIAFESNLNAYVRVWMHICIHGHIYVYKH
jgi:hypothetical protein